MAMLKYSHSVGTNSAATVSEEQGYLFCHILCEELSKLEKTQLTGSRFFNPKSGGDFDIYVPNTVTTVWYSFLERFTDSIGVPVHVYEHVHSQYSEAIFAERILRIYILGNHVDVIFYDESDYESLKNVHISIKNEMSNYSRLHKFDRNTIFNILAQGYIDIAQNNFLSGAEKIVRAHKYYNHFLQNVQ